MSNDLVAVVRQYLEATSAGRREEAVRYLADEFLVVFPHGRFGDFEELADSLKGRYSEIAKTYETFDVFADEAGAVVVVTGTLHGVNLNGVPFESVRYCDRFVIEDRKIVEHQVWNDLAQSGVLDRS